MDEVYLKVFFRLYGLNLRGGSVPAYAIEYAVVFDGVTNSFFNDVFVFILVAGEVSSTRFCAKLSTLCQYRQCLWFRLSQHWRFRTYLRELKMGQASLISTCVTNCHIFGGFVLQKDSADFVLDRGLPDVFVKSRLKMSLGFYSDFCQFCPEQTYSVEECGA